MMGRAKHAHVVDEFSRNYFFVVSLAFSYPHKQKYVRRRHLLDDVGYVGTS